MIKIHKNTVIQFILQKKPLNSKQLLSLESLQTTDRMIKDVYRQDWLHRCNTKLQCYLNILRKWELHISQFLKCDIFLAVDGCIENSPDTAEFSREFQKHQHLFDPEHDYPALAKWVSWHRLNRLGFP